MSLAAVLDVARREIGTVESPPNSNKQKYGADYGWNGQYWCMQFVWWVLTHAGEAAAVPKTASTVAARNWYLGRGQWLSGAQVAPARPGDLVFFKFAGNNNVVNHVGIVEAVEPGGTLITIEGNTAGSTAADQRNGGGVYRKRRTRGNVVGFARPAYAGAPAPAAAKRPTIRRGDTGEHVKFLQRWLGVVGAGDPGYGTFGPATEAAVRRYQGMRGLVVDGIVGPKTWAEMGQ